MLGFTQKKSHNNTIKCHGLVYHILHEYFSLNPEQKICIIQYYLNKWW